MEKPFRKNTGPIYDTIRTNSSNSDTLRLDDKASGPDFCTDYLGAELPRNRRAKGEHEVDSYATFMLSQKKPAKKEPKAHHKWKTLSSKERRKLLQDTTDLKYETFVTIHQMWKEYMAEAFGLRQDGTSLTRPAAQTNLVKADLHGCMLQVVKSKCPSYVGCSGIVVQETKNVFKLIKKDNCVKVIPKANNWFQYTIGQCRVTLYGNHFATKPGERSSKKFKQKATIDM